MLIKQFENLRSDVYLLVLHESKKKAHRFESSKEYFAVHIIKSIRDF